MTTFRAVDENGKVWEPHGDSKKSWVQRANIAALMLQEIQRRMSWALLQADVPERVKYFFKNGHEENVSPAPDAVPGVDSVEIPPVQK